MKLDASRTKIIIFVHPHPLDWLHVETSFETVTGQLDDNSYLPLIPANTLNNTVRVEFEQNWLKQGYAFVRYSATFDQNNVSDFETTTEGFNLLSAGFGGTVKMFGNNLDISLAANNITNERYINHLSRLKPDGILNIGRNFSFGLNYTL